MRIWDITLKMHKDMVIYEGDPPFVVYPFSKASAKSGESYGMSVIFMGTHSGTHVDAPSHFVPGGDGIDKVALEDLCGPAHVADLTSAGDEITSDVLKRELPSDVERVLFKTKTSGLDGRKLTLDHAWLTESGAVFLREQIGVRLVGIDNLSIERWPNDGFPVHHALLDQARPGRPVVIVEALNLAEVDRGEYELFCLPLRTAGTDGAPARVILVRR